MTTTPKSTPGNGRSARRKIRTIRQLGVIAENARARGDSVVLAHGVFDLLHMGHIRHLEAARREGSLLIVTLTADPYVNKGPHRPVHSQTLRAEMLAALEYVDWVGVNNAPSAETVIEAIRPDVYVKGSDYAVAEEDVTGKITAEREAVERHGGRMVFTDDITFSSSALINRHLDIYDDDVRDFLDRFRTPEREDDLVALIEKVRDMKVLMVGDTIIDEYNYVLPMGKSAKEHLIATHYQSGEIFAGGVLAAANHTAAFCDQVDVITCFGGDDDYVDQVRDRMKPNVTLHSTLRDNAPTTRKTRFVDSGYVRKLFEVYYMDDRPLRPDVQAQIDQAIRERAGDYDLVIVTDFGHGLIAPSTIAALEAGARFLAVNTQTNSANHGFNLVTKYPHADFICIDAPEARLAVGDKSGPMDVIVTDKLAGRMRCNDIIVTHGRHGCYTYRTGQPIAKVPAFAKRAVDSVGAGDAFFSVTAPLVAAGGDLQAVGFLGNIVGAIKVGIVGHRSFIEKVDVLKAITAMMK